MHQNSPKWKKIKPQPPRRGFAARWDLAPLRILQGLSGFEVLSEPSLDVFTSSEPFIPLYLSRDPPRLFNFSAKSRLIRQR